MDNDVFIAECMKNGFETGLDGAQKQDFCDNMLTAAENCAWDYVDNQGAYYENALDICKNEITALAPVGKWIGESLKENRQAEKSKIGYIIAIALGAATVIGATAAGIYFGVKKHKQKAEAVKKTKIQKINAKLMVRVNEQNHNKNESAAQKKTAAGKGKLEPIKASGINGGKPDASKITFEQLEKDENRKKGVGKHGNKPPIKMQRTEKTAAVQNVGADKKKKTKKKKAAKPMQAVKSGQTVQSGTAARTGKK